MTTFDDREKAYEKKFQIDEELKFKVDCLAAQLLGQWAAAQLELSENDAVAYVDEVLDAEIKQGAHALLLAKVEKDFQIKGLKIARPVLEHQLVEFQSVVRKKLGGER